MSRGAREDAAFRRYLAATGGVSAGKIPLRDGVALQGGEGGVSAGKISFHASPEAFIKAAREERYYKREPWAGKIPVAVQAPDLPAGPSAGKKPLEEDAPELRGGPSAGKARFAEVDMSDWKIPNVNIKTSEKLSEDLSNYLRSSANLPSAGKRQLRADVQIKEFPASAGKRLISPRDIGGENEVQAVKGIAQATQSGTQVYFVQNSLNGGEISPEMLGRIDQPRYQTGCEVLENMIPLPQGGICKRPGMEDIGPSESGAKLIPFILSASQSLVLEIRPALSDDSAGGAYFFVWRGSERLATGIRLPYTRYDVEKLQYAQSADVVYLACDRLPPRKLMHYADDNWETEEISWKPSIAKPTGITLSAEGDREEGASTTEVWYDYVVTAIDENGEEGEPSDWTEANHIKTYKLSSNWNVHVRWTPVEGATEYRVYKKSSGVFGYIGRVEGSWDAAAIAASEANKARLKSAWESKKRERDAALVTAQEKRTWYEEHCVTTILNDDGTTSTRVSATGECSDANQEASAAEDNYNRLVVETEEAEAAYNAVKDDYSGPEFVDTNIEADTEDTPPIYDEPFSESGNYPSVVFFHQQRLGWASTRKMPLTIWLSSTGAYERMAYSVPPKDDDRIEVTLAATQVNKILWCQSDRDGLALGTEGGEWILKGAEGKALTPSDLTFQPQTSHGSQASSEPVLRAGNNLMFLQRGGRVIRTFTYAFESDRYRASDVTLLARHIFRDAALVSWAWQAEPFSIAWCVLSDGTLAGFTFMDDQQIWAWHRHVTDGKITDVTCIPTESGEDAVYFVVNRGTDEAPMWRMERLRSFYKDDMSSLDIYTDGLNKASYVGTCVPTLPDGNIRNGNSFLHVRKINAVKCRVIRATPFEVQVGESAALPMPVRSPQAETWAGLVEQYIDRHTDWAVPLDSGWRENDRLKLIFRGPGPATVLGIVTTVEVAELSGGQS